MQYESNFGSALRLTLIKEIERATMTRIGRYQIKVPDNFTDDASYRRDNLAPLKISRPNWVDQRQYANVAWLPYRSAYPNGT